MNIPVYNGGGLVPSPNFLVPQQPIGHSYPAPASPRLFPGALEAVGALPPRLNKVIWNLHNRYGASFDIALGNMLGTLGFASQGVANGRDSKGDSMPLGVIIHVVGVPASAKSATLRRLLEPVTNAMQDWPHQWEFDDATPQGIKRVSPVLGFCGHEEGDAFFDSALGRDFALQTSLRDGFVPVATRGKSQLGERKAKARTRFTIVVLIQPDRHEEWLEMRRKKALGQGALQRVWMVRSHARVDKSAIGRYPQAEGGLDDWDIRVSELLEEGKANAADGLANLPTMDLAMEASHALNQTQSRYDFMAEQGPLAQAPAVAARYHEIVSVLAGLFQLYEGSGRVVTLDAMRSAIVVADYLVGQWLGIVFPPTSTPAPQDELDALVILPPILEVFRATGKTCMRESEIVSLAKNMKWMPQRTKKALMALYASGQLLLVPRVINGRAVDIVELPASAVHRPMLVW